MLGSYVGRWLRLKAECQSDPDSELILFGNVNKET